MKDEKKIEPIETLKKNIEKAILEKNYSIAERFLSLGMRVYPGFLDKYGDPYFRKELIRLLLSLGRFEDAYALIPQDDSINPGWYHILFARAYDKIGDKTKAMHHWREFAKTRPYHTEAWDALRGKPASGFPEPFSTIFNKIPFFQIDIIFDVGANVGQSCLIYSQLFPNSQIFAFEPVTQTFKELLANTKKHKNINCYQLALGSSRCSSAIIAEGTSPMNRILKNEIKDKVKIEEVEITTLNDFCRDLGIKMINFLKIDTEGYDLEVLKGCGEFIKNIDFIQVEASANLYNQYHMIFTEIFYFLSNNGFYLFLILDQTHEWSGGGTPVLRRFDMVFINSKYVNISKAIVR